jgi:hypothetical protein
MAKGNTGNLLQHFVALRVAQRLVERWNQPDQQIEYIDCYSMAPWEPIEGDGSEGFRRLVSSLPAKQRHGDFVASVFIETWRQQGGLAAKNRLYPSTAVLLTAGFPDQAWRMRLHENDLAGGGKRQQLEAWARQCGSECWVEGDWTRSSLIQNSPAPRDRPVLVMLDPFQIVSDNARFADQPGYLSERQLEFLVQGQALDIARRPADPQAQPAVITMFSYSDAEPAVAGEIVRKQFEGWQICEVRATAHRRQPTPRCHACWIVSTGLGSPCLGAEAQAEWDCWSETN